MLQIERVYCLVRTDLPPEQQAVQAIHAAIEAARSGLIPSESVHPHLVLLAVPDERALERVARRLRSSGVRYRDFHEPDLGASLTALATEPVGKSMRRLFRSWPLLRFNHHVDRSGSVHVHKSLGFSSDRLPDAP